MVMIIVNGARTPVKSAPETPLLYVLRNELGLTGPQFGCGLAQCGACSILLGDEEVRACVFPLEAAAGKEITTLEGLPGRWARKRDAAKQDGEPQLHPVQQAWIEEQTPLCGFCQNGMMIKATELLERTPEPTTAQIKEAFTASGPSPHLCRCGSYTAIIEAVHRASAIMRKA
jgi:aerobic-type carbon monoxide dehydrogenase small subunit (CoxS/CutS family)